MPNKKIVGVILAAGKGSRIKPLNFEFPKPLLPVCNKPIIQYQIEEMKSLGINEVYIVVGHLGGKIKKYFGNGKKLGVNITYVKQKERLGIAHAVGQLEPYIKDPFLLFLGDIFYHPGHFQKYQIPIAATQSILSDYFLFFFYYLVHYDTLELFARAALPFYF